MTNRHPLLPIKTKLDLFAELISRDDSEGPLSVNMAAELMGARATQGNGYMQRLRRAMGDQAR